MIRFDYFLDAMRTLGVNTSESKIKELLDVKPIVQFWGWQTYICDKDVKRVIDFYWKIISPNDASVLESVRKIEFVSQTILQQKEIGAIGQNPTREANQVELNELFHDIQQGTDLALEMQRRGFAPIINDFDFSKTRLQYLIIDGVKFNRCNGANFINCYIRKTKVPTHSNFTNCLYLREGEPIPQLHEVSSLISHLKTNVTDLIMQTIKDASEFGNAREILEEFLKKYQGDGSQLWIEFAAIAAKINAYTFRRCFQKFGIKDEEARYNCALLDAGFLSWDYCFEDFNITNQEYLNQLALEYIKHNPNDLIRMIKIFKISDPDIKIKLALIVARSDCTNLAKNIHLLGITDQKALVEIALLCAKKRCEYVSEHFEKFGIKDPYSRYQIALECIKQDIWSLRHLKNFKLSHQQEIDLALTIAEEQCMAAYIEYFIIADESIRIAIAKKCARVHGGVTAQFIKDFDIKDKKVLIEIAFESVNNGHAPVVYVGNFEINDQAVLTELARKCAQVYPSGTLYYLENFKLKDKAELKSIVKLCLKEGIPDSKTFKLIGDTPENRAEILIQFLAETTLVYADLLEQKELFDVLPDLGNELTLEAMDQLHFEGLDIEVNKQSFKKIQNEYAQKQTAFWLVNTLTLLHPVINAEQRIWLNKTRMLNHIQKVEDPKVRWRLTGCLHKILMQNKQDCFEKIEVKNLESEKGKKAEKCLYLIELMCVILKEKNVSVDLIKKHQKIFVDDSAKLNVFLKAFSRLVNDDKLDAKSFENLIKRIFENERALIRSLSFLSAIYELNEERALFNSGNIEDTLRQILQDKIKDTITIDDVAAEKLYHLFGNFRNPEAIYIYISKLGSLNDERISKACKELLQSLLDDKFYELRYNSAENPHLKVIEESHSEVLNKWKMGREENFLKFYGELSKAERKVDLKAWFYQKIYDDGHYAPKGNILYEVLKDKRTIEVGLTQLGNDTDGQIQRLCLELMQEEELNYQKLNELLSLVSGQFAGDIKSLLYKQRDITADAVIVDTDDPKEILLCGTDVQGSCQNVTGDPKLNQGLLGYIMNGQTRLLAIKVRSGQQGTLLARCILRLLWDETQKKPVMFIERFYPSNISIQAEMGLKKLAKAKAIELGVDLVSLEQGEEYPNAIKSVGGRSPCEYVDAVYGVQKEGYEIKKCWVVGK